MEKRWLVFLEIEGEENFDLESDSDFELCNDAELAYLLLTHRVKLILKCEEG